MALCWLFNQIFLLPEFVLINLYFQKIIQSCICMFNEWILFERWVQNFYMRERAMSVNSVVAIYIYQMSFAKPYIFAFGKAVFEVSRNIFIYKRWTYTLITFICVLFKDHENIFYIVSSTKKYCTCETLIFSTERITKLQTFRYGSGLRMLEKGHH